jgi:hypothetical protein
MDAFGTNLGEKFAAAALEKYFEMTVVDKITNDDYVIDLKEGGGGTMHVLTYGDVTINDYTGADMSLQTLYESEGDIELNFNKDYYFKIPSLTKFESYVRDTDSALIKNAGAKLAEKADAFVLGLYADAGSGNRVGNDYTTGTVTVTTVTGECVGVGTNWTSAMQGLGFKAVGHTKWYRIVAHATHAISSTSMYIQNDSDDDTSSYDGGAISGAAYTIEAAIVLTVTATNIYGYICDLAEKLNTNKIPKSDRWLVVNAYIGRVLRDSEELTPALAEAYNDVIKKGLIGQVSGFTVYENEQVSGNSTTGYYIMAGHKSAITFGQVFSETGIEDLVGNFGKAYKGLVVGGGKVIDERRKALAYMFCKR